MTHSPDPVFVGSDLSLDDRVAVARRGVCVAIDPAARDKVNAARRAIDLVADGGGTAPRGTA